MDVLLILSLLQQSWTGEEAGLNPTTSLEIWLFNYTTIYLEITISYHFSLNNCCIVVRLNIKISQGSAATDLRRGGRFYSIFLRSSSVDSAVKSYKIAPYFP